MTMYILRTLLIATLVVGGGACGGDDETAGPDTTPATTEPATTEPATTEPATTEPATTLPDTTEPATTLPDTTEPATTLPDTTEPATTLPDTTQPAALVDVRVYFLRGERLVIEHHDVEGPAVLRGALNRLVAGPDGDLSTAVPDGTELLDVDLANGTATVDLSGEFGSGGGTMSMTARVAQVVFTATQFDNVDRVVFWLDGAPIEYLGGEGLVMTDPWERMDVPRELTGGVLVDTPRPGDTVTSPFTVTGEADVFEGDFPIEIRRGDEVLAVIAPVTGGAWGAWADFTTTVDIDAEPGPIELVAYDAGGCGDDPECPPIIETVVPLTLG
jgi:germination protein M